MTIKDDAVRICLHKNGRELTAKLPDGTPIPFIKEITVKSSVNNLISATIDLIVHVEDVEKWDKVLSKEVIVQKSMNESELLQLINK